MQLVDAGDAIQGEPLGSLTRGQAVIDIMMINASVHTAVVSDMDPDEFHEATEGLGILMPLPTSPKADDAERLLKALAGVM